MYQSNIWKMYVFLFLKSLFFISGVIIPFFIDWGGISFFQVMILQTVFVASVFLLEVPTGAIADYFGRKTSIILSGLIGIIAPLVYASAPNFYIFMLGEFLWAMGFALLSGADEALIYDGLKHDKKESKSKKIFGRYSSMHIIGITIAAPIGSLIAGTIGLRFTMTLISVPALFSFIIAFTLKEPPYQKTKKHYFRTLASGFSYIRDHKILKILAFDRISIFVLSFMIIWLYQLVLTDFKFPLIYFGFIAMLIAGVELPVMNNFHFFEKFISKKKYLICSALIVGFAYILMGFSTNVWLSIFLMLVITAFGLTRSVLFQSYMNKYIESKNRATVISTVSMIQNFTKGIVYIIVGLMVEFSLYLTLIILGLAIVVSVIVSGVKEEHLID